MRKTQWRLQWSGGDSRKKPDVEAIATGATADFAGNGAEFMKGAVICASAGTSTGWMLQFLPVGVLRQCPAGSQQP